MTYLIERDGDEEQTKYRVEVVVHGAAEAGSCVLGFPPMCQGAKEKLREVQYEDGDTPSLMVVVEMRTALPVNLSDGQCDTGHNDRQTCAWKPINTVGILRRERAYQ